MLFLLLDLGCRGGVETKARETSREKRHESGRVLELLQRCCAGSYRAYSYLYIVLGFEEQGQLRQRSLDPLFGRDEG